ncbi:hypothetical protein OEG84_00380 [Hoeflea sp. G2-23]|uniref:Uncharacterized protein n=1 Tax=Hoeflea algicola TaxID=2983763 RepID=A0ABT3Z366_9HYPH|nr:hypothetical protein [Hoeflea algicola]MCY0146212.1 hypothetical protein [Hoeflea algicola]
MTEDKKTEKMEALALLIYKALEESDPEAYMGDFDTAYPVTIDGKVNLLVAARFLAERIE